jgi:hypothetical protein
MLSELKIKQLIKAGTPNSGIADTNGLMLTITKKGKAGFYFRYQFNGCRHKFLIGHYPALSLHDARLQCSQYRQLILEGRDPKVERRKHQMRHHTRVNDIFEHSSFAMNTGVLSVFSVES